MNIDNITFAMGLENTIAISILGISTLVFLIMLNIEGYFPSIFKNISEKTYERILLVFGGLAALSILYFIITNFVELLIGWIIGTLLAIAWSVFMYKRFYKYRLYKILGLLAKENGSGHWFPVEHIFRKLKKEYPKKYKDKKFRDFENKLREYLGYLVDDGVAEKFLGKDLEDNERVGKYRSWHYRRKPGFEFKSKSKILKFFFSGKFN